MWNAVENKVAAAEFFLTEMGRDLVPPEATDRAMAAIAASTGAIVSHPWQGRLYHHFDAFLAMTRSVPDIVRCCFGFDPSKAMRPWLDSLDTAEITRRKAFDARFQKPFEDFKRLPLSGARNVTLHRHGAAPVEVQITGRWGVYTGGPLERVPESETPGIATLVHDPGWMYAATLPPQPIRPSANDFWLLVDSVSGQTRIELFPECKLFLERARQLVTEAKTICPQEYGAEKITPPPAY
jgi:hypothetical protein